MRNSSSGLHYDLDHDSEIINDGEIVEIRRYHVGVIRQGVYQQNEAYDTFTIKASIQPASGDEILQVAELDRDKQTFVMYSPTDLQKNDILVRDDKLYEIQIVEHWGSYSRSIAVLKDV